jgi:hypothetical protein
MNGFRRRGEGLHVISLHGVCTWNLVHSLELEADIDGELDFRDGCQYGFIGKLVAAIRAKDKHHIYMAILISLMFL